MNAKQLPLLLAPLLLIATSVQAQSVSGLPYGLTENAIDAARKIKFVPDHHGRIVNIQVLSPGHHGLTEASIAAAEQITFVPAIKNGKNVSQYIMLEYNYFL